MANFCEPPFPLCLTQGQHPEGVNKYILNKWAQEHPAGCDVELAIEGLLPWHFYPIGDSSP